MAKSNLYVVLTNEKKLGDALIAFNAAASFAENIKSTEKLILFARFEYAFLCSHERIRVVPFIGGIDRILLLLILSLIKKFSLVNISGENGKIRLIRALTKPRYFSSRIRDYAYDSIGNKLFFKHESNFEYTWAPFSFISTNEMPTCISNLSLEATIGDSYYIINPYSTEKRRDLPMEAVKRIHSLLSNKARLNNSKVIILVANEEQKSKIIENMPAQDCETIVVSKVSKLMAYLKSAVEIHTCDTGVYPLAVALGVGVDVYYGPSQPSKADYCIGSEAVRKHRLQRLGNIHCDNKLCSKAVCINELLGIPSTSKYPDDCIARWGGM